MAHIITPITLQGVAGYDDTFIYAQDGTGPTAWDYTDPFPACCQPAGVGYEPFVGTTPRLFQSSGHDDLTDLYAQNLTESVFPTGPAASGLSCRVLWASTDAAQLGVVVSGSIQFGVCCSSYAYLTMWGQMRGQAAYDGDDWCQVYVNGVLAWEHSSDNTEARDYWDTYGGDPNIADMDFSTYQYSEGITLTLDPSRACGNIIEIRSSSGSATISQAELDASTGSTWAGLFWFGILTSLA